MFFLYCFHLWSTCISSSPSTSVFFIIVFMQRRAVFFFPAPHIACTMPTYTRFDALLSPSPQCEEITSILGATGDFYVRHKDMLSCTNVVTHTPKAYLRGRKPLHVVSIHRIVDRHYMYFGIHIYICELHIGFSEKHGSVSTDRSPIGRL